MHVVLIVFIFVLFCFIFNYSKFKFFFGALHLKNKHTHTHTPTHPSIKICTHQFKSFCACVFVFVFVFNAPLIMLLINHFKKIDAYFGLIIMMIPLFKKFVSCCCCHQYHHFNHLILFAYYILFSHMVSGHMVAKINLIFVRIFLPVNRVKDPPPSMVAMNHRPLNRPQHQLRQLLPNQNRQLVLIYDHQTNHHL